MPHKLNTRLQQGYSWGFRLQAAPEISTHDAKKQTKKWSAVALHFQLILTRLEVVTHTYCPGVAIARTVGTLR